MSTRKSKKGQKLASSRRNINRNRNNETEENESNDRYTQPGNEELEDHKEFNGASKNQLSEAPLLHSVQAATACTSQQTFVSDLHPHCKDLLDQAEAVNKRRKMGSTRKSNRGFKGGGMPEEDPEVAVKLTEGICEEHGTTVNEVLIKEDGSREGYEHQGLLGYSSDQFSKPESSALQREHLVFDSIHEVDVPGNNECPDLNLTFQIQPMGISACEPDQLKDTALSYEAINTSCSVTVATSTESKLPLHEFKDSFQVYHDMETILKTTGLESRAGSAESSLYENYTENSQNPCPKECSNSQEFSSMDVAEENRLDTPTWQTFSIKIAEDISDHCLDHENKTFKVPGDLEKECIQVFKSSEHKEGEEEHTTDEKEYEDLVKAKNFEPPKQQELKNQKEEAKVFSNTEIHYRNDFSSGSILTGHMSTEENTIQTEENLKEQSIKELDRATRTEEEEEAENDKAGLLDFDSESIGIHFETINEFKSEELDTNNQIQQNDCEELSSESKERAYIDIHAKSNQLPDSKIDQNSGLCDEVPFLSNKSTVSEARVSTEKELTTDSVIDLDKDLQVSSAEQLQQKNACIKEDIRYKDAELQGHFLSKAIKEQTGQECDLHLCSDVPKNDATTLCSEEQSKKVDVELTDSNSADDLMDVVQYCDILLRYEENVMIPGLSTLPDIMSDQVENVVHQGESKEGLEELIEQHGPLVVDDPTSSKMAPPSTRNKNDTFTYHEASMAGDVHDMKSTEKVSSDEVHSSPTCRTMDIITVIQDSLDIPVNIENINEVACDQIRPMSLDHSTTDVHLEQTTSRESEPVQPESKWSLNSDATSEDFKIMCSEQNMKTAQTTELGSTTNTEQLPVSEYSESKEDVEMGNTEIQAQNENKTGGTFGSTQGEHRQDNEEEEQKLKHEEPTESLEHAEEERHWQVATSDLLTQLSPGSEVPLFINPPLEKEIIGLKEGRIQKEMPVLNANEAIQQVENVVLEKMSKEGLEDMIEQHGKSVVEDEKIDDSISLNKPQMSIYHNSSQETSMAGKVEDMESSETASSNQVHSPPAMEVYPGTQDRLDSSVNTEHIPEVASDQVRQFSWDHSQSEGRLEQTANRESELVQLDNTCSLIPVQDSMATQDHVITKSHQEQLHRDEQKESTEEIGKRSEKDGPGANEDVIFISDRSEIPRTGNEVTEETIDETNAGLKDCSGFSSQTSELDSNTNAKPSPGSEHSESNEDGVNNKENVEMGNTELHAQNKGKKRRKFGSRRGAQGGHRPDNKGEEHEENTEGLERDKEERYSIEMTCQADAIDLLTEQQSAVIDPSLEKDSNKEKTEHGMTGTLPVIKANEIVQQVENVALESKDTEEPEDMKELQGQSVEDDEWTGNSSFSKDMESSETASSNQVQSSPACDTMEVYPGTQDRSDSSVNTENIHEVAPDQVRQFSWDHSQSEGRLEQTANRESELVQLDNTCSLIPVQDSMATQDHVITKGSEPHGGDQEKMTEDIKENENGRAANEDVYLTDQSKISDTENVIGDESIETLEEANADLKDYFTSECPQKLNSGLSSQITQLGSTTNIEPLPGSEDSKSVDSKTVPHLVSSKEIHAQDQTKKKRKFGSTRRSQGGHRAEKKGDEETTEAFEHGKEERCSKAVYQVATSDLLSVVSDVSIGITESIKEHKELEMVETLSVIMSNVIVHQLNNVILEEESKSEALVEMTEPHVQSEVENERTKDPTYSKIPPVYTGPQKDTSQETSMSVEVHDMELDNTHSLIPLSMAAQDNVITMKSELSTSGQRRKMGSTRRSHREQLHGGDQKISTEENIGNGVNGEVQGDDIGHEASEDVNLKDGCKMPSIGNKVLEEESKETIQETKDYSSSEDIVLVCSEQKNNSGFSSQAIQLGLTSNTEPSPVTEHHESKEDVEMGNAELLAHNQSDKKRKFGSTRRTHRQDNKEEEEKWKDEERAEELETCEGETALEKEMIESTKENRDGIIISLPVILTDIVNHKGNEVSKELVEVTEEHKKSGVEKVEVSTSSEEPSMVVENHDTNITENRIQSEVHVSSRSDTTETENSHEIVSNLSSWGHSIQVEHPRNREPEEELLKSSSPLISESKKTIKEISGKRKKMGSTRKSQREQLHGSDQKDITEETDENEKTKEKIREEIISITKEVHSEAKKPNLIPAVYTMASHQSIDGQSEPSESINITTPQLEKSENKKRKMGSTRKNFKGSDSKETPALTGNIDSSFVENIATESTTNADTVCTDTTSEYNVIAETKGQEDKPQISHIFDWSESSLLSEIVEQCKSTLELPLVQSSQTCPKPSSPGRKRKMGSTRKTPKNRPEVTDSENLETEKENELEREISGDKRTFGSRHTTDVSRNTSVLTHGECEANQQETEDIQVVADELTVCDPYFISEPKSSPISHSASDHDTMKTSLGSEQAGQPVVSVPREADSFNLRKTAPFNGNTGRREEIDFEKWNEQIPDFGVATYNVVILGNTSVGKTSFIKRLQSGHFSEDYSSTIGVDTFVQTITLGNRTVKLHVWDTAGQERYHSITRQVFHKAQGFLLMYDITCSQSFCAVRNWISQIQESAPADVTLMLLGNKNDCAKRQVQVQDGEDLSREYNIYFMECSAATGENVPEAMKTLAWLLVKQKIKKEEQAILQPKQKSSCC